MVFFFLSPRGLRLPYPHLSVLPVSGLSPDAPGHVCETVCINILLPPPTGTITPQMKATPGMTATATVTLTAAFWILSRDQWVSGVGHGDFRNLLSFSATKEPCSGRPFGPQGKLHDNEPVIFLCWNVRNCTHFLDALDHSAPVWEKASIVNPMVLFQISHRMAHWKIRSWSHVIDKS